MAQKLEKAKIKTIRPSGSDIEVLFNPSEYSLSKSNQFSEVAIPGLSAPMLQFGRGNAQTLTMQLFFDTFDPTPSSKAEKDKDVRTYTRRVTDLMNINAELHAPPVCQFSWGNLQFIGVLEQANLKCTMFLPSGIPVRATVDVTFKQFYDGVNETGMLQSSHFHKYYLVRHGDTLSSIAGKMYEDPAKWRFIAEENKIDNPLRLTVGQELRIPSIE